LQALPSLHGVPSGLAGFEQTPVAGSQTPASWHWSEAVHTTGAPLVQAPLLHVSPMVQALPSSQDAVLLTCSQPATGSQESVVQTLPSSQFGGGVPMQEPSWHVPVPLQTSPSSQEAVLLTWTHPVAGSQESSVQTLASSQSGGGPLTQTPLVQTSGVVHALPSLQVEPSGFARFEQTPVAGSQAPAS
jgi:hypothetical protein